MLAADLSRSISLSLNVGRPTRCRSRSRQCHLPFQPFPPILSDIVKLFILNTSLIIRTRLKKQRYNDNDTQTHLAIRIRAAVTLLRSVVIRFVNMDQI